MGIASLTSLRAAAAVLAFSLTANVLPASAADLKISFQGVQSSPDPHWMTAPRNWTVNHHIFEPIVRRDNKGGIEPWLASSWKRVDDVTWEFYLRKGVKWHDGSPFTADDVLFTIERIKRGVPNAPTPFTGYVKYIEKIEAPDRATIRITTKGPAPALLQDLAYLLIVSRKNGENATTADYNSGKAAIGTGAYLFVSFNANSSSVLKRNPDYWGEKQPWDTVTFNMVPQDATRVASLLAGDVDIIESVPTSDIARLKNDPRVKLWSSPTGRIVYMAVDVSDETLASGRIMGIDGKPLTKNPLADKRVREALKLAIDLEQFTKRIYQDEAIATGQYVLPGVFGFNPELKPWKGDMARARKLLEESGWADKFKLTLGINDTVFQNAVQTGQAAAQAFTRIGIPTDVTTMPNSVFLVQWRERKLPVTMMTRQNSPLIADAFFPIVIHSPSGNGGGTDEEGLGTSNYTKYTNPEVDRLIDAAMVTMDDDKRSKLYQEAAKLAVADAQITPLWLINETIATKPNLDFIARPDRSIFAMNVKPKP